jgi:UDP-N-acetylglucosamine/UDP-N-acetylgalactosamine 4-epimerase
MTRISTERILTTRDRWTVTGVAGFIGSHLAEALIEDGQDVVGLDDFSTGSRDNVTFLADTARANGAGSFRFVEGSIEETEACTDACDGARFVLHQAALGSIPRSIENPLRTHSVNVTGTLNMLVAARDAGVKRFVYASSSSVYGDDTTLPKQEDRAGMPLAPYASSKRAGELYARNFSDHYGLDTVGLRYFNVFGPRQDPNGAYAAVIPRWISSLARREETVINGDGETSRDFCYVANVVQANLLAATYADYDARLAVFNIANGGRTSLNELQAHIRSLLADCGVTDMPDPVHKEERAGDVRHSQADISRAQSVLGYAPTHDVLTGLRETVSWYCDNAAG